MTRASSIAYSALFLVVVVTVWDLYRLFVPDLSGSFDTPRLKPSGIKGDSYSWKVCLSESAEEITHQALATECVMDMKYIRFDEKTNWQKNVTLPSHYLLKFARQHGEYQRTHQEYVRLSHELEEARLLQQRHSQTNRQREAKDPDAIIAAAATQQSNVSTLSSLIIQLDRQRDELIRLRQTIRSSGLYLHHFFWRSTFHDPFSDSFHVHTSTPLLIRIVERRNTSRNLLASSTDGTDVKSVSGVNSSHRPSSELWYQFRRTHPFQFIYDGLTFPVSHIPPELHAFFPQNEIRKKNGGLYKPLIIEQPFFVLRKHWKRLGDETFIRACMTKEGADDEDEEHHHTRQSKRVHVNDEEYDRDDDDGADEISFSTIPTTTPGVSDEVFVSRLETAVSEFLASGGHQLTFQLQASSLGYYRLLASMAESSDLIALMTQTGNEVVDQQIASLTALSPSSLSSSIAHTKLQSLKLHTDLVSHATLGEDVSIDAEQLKELWSESNPWLIGLTTLIGGIHLLFDLLAVKNDIGFFRQTAKKNDFAGISAKSIWAHTIMRTIIFLYLLDDDNTSRMVLVSVALGLGVSYWKSIQLLRIKFEITNRFPFLLTFASHSQSAGERKTNEYDAKALRFLGWASIPFIGGCTIYSLIYQTHKSWYSFVLSSFALSIYIGGFISMTPQLYVNYRLKTVAHMPLRVFIYRACNTFIDDLFAWLLSMPTLHRVATLRDDIIFFIYLYQRWIYPTDKTRNLKFDDEEEEEEEEVKENGSGSRSLPPIHAKPPKTDRSSAPPPTPSFPSSLTSPSSSSSRATGGVVELVDSSAASPKLTRRHQAHNGNEKKD